MARNTLPAVETFVLTASSGNRSAQRRTKLRHIAFGSIGNACGLPAWSDQFFPPSRRRNSFFQRTARRRIAGLSNTRLPPLGRQRRNGSPPQWFPIDASRPIQSAESAVAIEIWQSWQTPVCPDSSLPPDAWENTQLAANFLLQASALCLARARPDRTWLSGEIRQCGRRE